jgi:predicted MFS family arabinose efflux permease
MSTRSATASVKMRQYLTITGNYWAFTLTDGALRMLVILHFHALGYSPLAIAMLFLFYEVFGVITNLVGGWLGARIGLTRIMNMGLLLQIIALAMLLVPVAMLTVPWVMLAQALSGVAKDLNKMSAKASVKKLVPTNHDNVDNQGGEESQLFKWVARLTGSKNAMKGFGFFLGGLLLTLLGFQTAILGMAVALTLVWLSSLILLPANLGQASNKPKFTDIFSKSRSINLLSAARLFLFGARDVWFVVALPVFLATELNWSHWQVGSFLAAWIIGYGIVQSLAPSLYQRRTPDGNSALRWALLLAFIPAFIALALLQAAHVQMSLIVGLLVFGVIFAINSSIHSYLIVSYADADGVSMDVGFYYMANAMGRLIGTVLSGWVFQVWGLAICLLISTLFLLTAALLSRGLPALPRR